MHLDVGSIMVNPDKRNSSTFHNILQFCGIDMDRAAVGTLAEMLCSVRSLVYLSGLACNITRGTVRMLGVTRRGAQYTGIILEAETGRRPDLFNGARTPTILQHSLGEKFVAGTSPRRVVD